MKPGRGRLLVAMALACAFISATQATAFAQAPAAAAATELAPDMLARSVTDEVLAILRADQHAGDSRKLLQLVEAKVLPHFNFARMAQLAAGRNWRQATPDQQKALTDEFRTLLVRTYATAFMLYRNQNIDYRPVRTAAGETDVVVGSTIRQPSGPPVSVDYRMEKLAGAWKVYDVKIEGVSLVENYRHTFNSEIQKNGIDGLVRTLATRNRALEAQSAK